MSKSNGVAAGPPRACETMEHQWGFLDDIEIGDWVCRGCKARGVDCPVCTGGQVIVCEGALVDCHRCKGTGVVEVVEITAAEVVALKRDRRRLETAEELWLQVCNGESLIEAVDQLGATVVRGLAGGRRVSVPVTAPAGEWPDLPDPDDTGEFDTAALANGA